MVVTRRVVTVEVAGQLGEGGLDDAVAGGPERDALLADELGADQPADQGEPTPEDDPGPPLGFDPVEGVPPVAERAEVEGVDAALMPGPDGEGLDAERAAQRFVLVLRVAEDEHLVAEVHHQGREVLGVGWTCRRRACRR